MRQRFPSAAHWGAFTAVVEDGRLVATEPFAMDPEPNELNDTWPEMLYAPARIAGPMVRRGWLHGRRDRPDGRRGADSFVPVSWDRALTLVADELGRVRTEHGAPAIFAGSYGWSSAGRLHHARTLLHRFMAVDGGCTGQVTNYSFGAGMILMPHLLGSVQAVAGPVTEWDAVFLHCDEFLAFGGVAAKNWKVQSGGCGHHTHAATMARAGASRTRFTNISPLRTDAPDAMGAEWLPIRPGTDTALILALCHATARDGAEDQAFLASHTVGYGRVRAYLMGDTDGQPKSPDWAAAITGIPADTIEALARRLRGGRTMLTAAWSLQRAENGEQPFWALVTLAAMLGQIGLPGAGVAFGYGSMNETGGPDYNTPVSGMPVPPGPNDLKIPVARVADLLLHPGELLQFNGAVLRYPDTRLVYWAGGNPFHHHQDLFRLRRAFQRPDTVIVHEPWWTATARHADIVLPATTPLERNDIAGSSKDPFILAMHKAVEPVGQARDDLRIFTELAVRLGADEAFTEGRDEMGWLRHMWAGSARRLHARGIEAPAFDAFWARGWFRLPEPKTTLTLLAPFRADPAAHPLATPSGRVELFSETVAGFGYPGLPGHAAWVPPAEFAGAPGASAHPLHLLTPQPADKLHSQHDGGATARAAKIDGRAVLTIHPGDARARGIADGGVVRLWNHRGAVLAAARLSPDITQGVVTLPTGAWFAPGPDGDNTDVHGNPNVLTRDVGTSRLGQGCAAQSCLVEAAAYAGIPPRVRAFDPPDCAPAPDLVPAH